MAGVQVEIGKYLPLEQDMKRAAILRVMGAAARGQLTEGDDLGPVRRQPPDVYELRWNFGKLLYRLYFAEPPGHPGHLVALLFHVKDVLGLTEQEIRDDQDQQISAAMLRYAAGERDGWGI